MSPILGRHAATAKLITTWKSYEDTQSNVDTGRAKVSDEKGPLAGIDLELATTSQIMAELAKRNKSFVMLFDTGSGITNKENTMECHVSGLNPQETFDLLGESAMMMDKLLSGETPEGMSVQFMTIGSDGEYHIVDMPPISQEKLLEDMTEEERGYDPWGNSNGEDEEE